MDRAMKATRRLHPEQLMDAGEYEPGMDKTDQQAMLHELDGELGDLMSEVAELEERVAVTAERLAGHMAGTPSWQEPSPSAAQVEQEPGGSIGFTSYRVRQLRRRLFEVNGYLAHFQSVLGV